MASAHWSKLAVFHPILNSDPLISARSPYPCRTALLCPRRPRYCPSRRPPFILARQPSLLEAGLSSVKIPIFLRLKNGQAYVCVSRPSGLQALAPAQASVRSCPPSPQQRRNDQVVIRRRSAINRQAQRNPKQDTDAATGGRRRRSSRRATDAAMGWAAETPGDRRHNSISEKA
ncbi:hypothetical protein ON010_g6572 [Phytophthora cinnamomi]|nr:hypothetical protein ON010_g6572 [Phytophthora cinnamomi]